MTKFVPIVGHAYKAADGGNYGYVVLGPPDEKDEVPVRVITLGEIRRIDRFKMSYRYTPIVKEA